MSTSRRLARRVLCIVLLLLLTASALPAAAVLYRDLAVGDRGDDVVALKERLFALGYYSTSQFTDQYTADTGERIAEFLSKYGMDGTAATAAVQEMLFAADARTSAAVSVSDPSAITEPQDAPMLPACAGDGTLLDKTADPYLYQNEDDGLWIYIGPTLAIEIRRYYDEADNVKWFETRVRLSGGNRLRALFSDDRASGKQYDFPLNIAKKNEAILAFSDDFFGWRKYYNRTEGIIIRSGRIYSDKTYPADRDTNIPLDVLAVFEDGTIKTFLSDQYTAEEYLAMGAVHTYAFGPVLVRDGVVTDGLSRADWDAPEPRNAMGMIKANDYVFVTVLGRRRDSDGSSVAWLARRMAAIGAVEALNLDGGNSTMLVFNGRMLNKVSNENTDSIRQMPAMIGFRELD